MRAMAIGEDRRLVEIDAPEGELEPDEVRLEVAFCGICGSDLHMRPSQAVPAGVVMGHEFSGRVVETASGVDGWSEGDRVCVFPFMPCGECAMCREGHPNVCVDATVTGIGLGARPGAYAERIAVPASTLHKLPDGLSDEHGALVEPLAVALHALAIAGVGPSDPVAVIGAGPIGLMTAWALRADGFERLVVIERNPERAALLGEMGFEAIGLEDVHMSTIARLGGELPAAVFECAGNPAAPQLGIELVRPRGCVVLAGVLEEPVPISQLVLLVKEAQLRASFAYEPHEFERAIELLASGAVPGERLVTQVSALEQAQEMFDELERPGTKELKVLLAP